MTDTKVCNNRKNEGCGQELPLTAFGIDNKAKDGRRSLCKDCSKRLRDNEKAKVIQEQETAVKEKLEGAKDVHISSMIDVDVVKDVEGVNVVKEQQEQEQQEQEPQQEFKNVVTIEELQQGQQELNHDNNVEGVSDMEEQQEQINYMDDPTLSAKAKGLMSIIVRYSSRCDSWGDMRAILEVVSQERENALNSGLTELRASNYLKTERQIAADGKTIAKWIYSFRESIPIVEKLDGYDLQIKALDKKLLKAQIDEGHLQQKEQRKMNSIKTQQAVIIASKEQLRTASFKWLLQGDISNALDSYKVENEGKR